jgi:quercetin 2,3-dioxygenase
MIKIRKEAERGKADHGWLKTSHSFSFADYYDPEHMQFRSLRVINDDFIAARTGFPKHPHNDMEIITYVMEGELQHEDSIGNRAVIKPGEIQVMHAGTGIYHSEKNPSADTTRLLQILDYARQAWT